MLFVCLSSLSFGAAVVIAKRGLRTLDARASAAISIPTATVLFVAVSPFALDLSDLSLTAALVSALEERNL